MHDIVHELTIAAAPAKIFEAVTTQQGLSSWWTTDCSATPAVDTEATFAFEGHSVVFTMRVDLLEPPELVHWECTGGPDEWVGTKIAFRIEAVEGADGANGGGGPAVSIVRFWHGGWEFEDGLLPRCSFEWAMYLDSLRRFIETGTGSPASG